jgi:hypothetical protein
MGTICIVESEQWQQFTADLVSGVNRRCHERAIFKMFNPDFILGHACAFITSSVK